jgi:hypothetical protein
MEQVMKVVEVLELRNLKIDYNHIKEDNIWSELLIDI